MAISWKHQKYNLESIRNDHSKDETAIKTDVQVMTNTHAVFLVTDCCDTTA